MDAALKIQEKFQQLNNTFRGWIRKVWHEPRILTGVILLVIGFTAVLIVIVAVLFPKTDLHNLGNWMRLRRVRELTAACPPDPGMVIVNVKGFTIDMTGEAAVGEYYDAAGCQAAGGKMRFTTVDHQGQPGWMGFMSSGQLSILGSLFKTRQDAWVYPLELPQPKQAAEEPEVVTPDQLFLTMQKQDIWYLETDWNWDGDFSRVHLYQGSQELICDCSSMEQYVDRTWAGSDRPFLFVKRHDSEMGQDWWTYRIWVGLEWAPFN